MMDNNMHIIYFDIKEEKTRGADRLENFYKNC
jgi:hypothetical protein